MNYQMNPQRQRHMDGKPPAGAQDVEQESGQHHAPHMSIHSHSGGHHVHITHHDGRYEDHQHSHGDAEGIAAHIHKHFGGGAGNVASEGAEHPFEEEEFS